MVPPELVPPGIEPPRTRTDGRLPADDVLPTKRRRSFTSASCVGQAPRTGSHTWYMSLIRHRQRAVLPLPIVRTFG